MRYDVIVMVLDADRQPLDSVLVRNVTTLDAAKDRAAAWWARQLPDVLTAVDSGQATIVADFTVILDA